MGDNTDEDTTTGGIVWPYLDDDNDYWQVATKKREKVYEVR